MKGGGIDFSKMRETCDTKYKHKNDIIKDILFDFNELKELFRLHPYLPISYNESFFSLSNLRSFSIEELEEILERYAKNLNENINLNNIVKQFALLFKQYPAANVIRRINDNYPLPYSELIIDCLVRMGVYSPPVQNPYSNLVYQAGVDQYAEARSRNSFNDRRSMPYSGTNFPSYNSRSAPPPQNFSPPPQNFSQPPPQNFSPPPPNFFQSNFSQPPPRTSFADEPERENEPQQEHDTSQNRAKSPEKRKYFPKKDEVLRMTSDERKKLKMKYKKLALLYHPDKSGEKDTFQEIQNEYDDLKDIKGMKVRKNTKRRKTRRKNTKKKKKLQN